jgi:glycine cleavage system transcriptional repressor
VRLAVSAIGRDRPGIVAGVTGVLLRHRANIEDSQMGILRGHFAMTLVVSAPDDVDRDALAHELRAAGEELDLEAISLSELDEADTAHAEPSHVVTVYGADHPGILHAVAAALAAGGVNIRDLTTRLVAEDDNPLYVAFLEVEAAGEIDALLDPVAREQGVEISVTLVERDSL